MNVIEYIDQKVEEGYGNLVNVIANYSSDIVSYGILQQLSRIADSLEQRDARQVRVDDLIEHMVNVEGCDIEGPAIARNLLRTYDIRERRADK